MLWQLEVDSNASRCCHVKKKADSQWQTADYCYKAYRDQHQHITTATHASQCCRNKDWWFVKTNHKTVNRYSSTQCSACNHELLLKTQHTRNKRTSQVETWTNKTHRSHAHHSIMLTKEVHTSCEAMINRWHI